MKWKFKKRYMYIVPNQTNWKEIHLLKPNYVTEPTIRFDFAHP